MRLRRLFTWKAVLIGLAVIVALPPAFIFWMLAGYFWIDDAAMSLRSRATRDEVDRELVWKGLVGYEMERWDGEAWMPCFDQAPGEKIVRYRLVTCPLLYFNVCYDAQGRLKNWAPAYE